MNLPKASWHLSTGIFQRRMMFDVLRENDMNDVAYRIANQPDYPGWGNMVENGATTLWETWAYPESGLHKTIQCLVRLMNGFIVHCWALMLQHRALENYH